MTSAAPKAILDIQQLSFAYDRGNTICRDLSLSVMPGEIASLLGPSGCGKTTILRLIAGFEHPLSGTISLGGNVVADATTSLPAERRNVGFVFQDFALFPHLTIHANVGFGLRGLTANAKSERIAEMLNLVSLGNMGHRYPHELSGGQRQRIALARALAPRPTLLLMDEPFASLDIELREKLSLEVGALLRQLKTTALMVTHDQHEAFSLADRIAVMNQGRIEQWDSAYNLYHRPATRFVADFIGQGVLLRGDVLANDAIRTELGVLAHCPGCSLANGERVDVLLRPDDILHDDASPLQAEVMHKAFRGADILYTLKLESGTKVLSLVPSHHNHELGQKIGIKLEIDHVVAFPT